MQTFLQPQDLLFGRLQIRRGEGPGHRKREIRKGGRSGRMRDQEEGEIRKNGRSGREGGRKAGRKDGITKKDQRKNK